MAKTQEAAPTTSLEEKAMDPEIKMEEEEDSAGEEKETPFLPKTSVKQEPDEGPSGNWDDQLREFVMRMQAHPSSGELPEWSDVKMVHGPFQRVTEHTRVPRQPLLSESHPHQRDQKPRLDDMPSAEKQPEGTLPGGAARVEMRRRLFRTLCYQDARGPRELCGWLLDLCRQWLEPERRPTEQILELVTLEQFVAVLPLEMQSWVRGKGPESCTQAVALAEEFLLRDAQGCGEQITGMYKEESATNPAQANQVSPGTEEMLVLLETKQEGGASTAVLAGNGWLREKEEEKPLPPSPKHPRREMQAAFLITARENGCLSEGEAGETKPGAKRQKAQDEGRGEDLHGVCEGAGRIAGVREENTWSEKSWDGSGENAPLSFEEKPYKCWHCGQIFASSSDLLSHERNHVGEKLYTCAQCGQSERIHMGQKPHKCSHCGSTFSGGAEEEVHGRKKAHACPICGKAYTQISGYLQHLGLHRGEKPYRCSKCAERFGTYTALRVHRKTHTGENQYTCSHCGMCFSCSPHLRAHERTHLATCASCGRSFGRTPELAEHERSHARGDPPACFACGKAFGAASELLAHVRSHAEKPPEGADARKTFNCPECGDTFRHGSALRVHQRIHTGEKP